jgi:peptidoglycan/xylan/chitin deacetylase (PgdA/CDA1 family)
MPDQRDGLTSRVSPEPEEYATQYRQVYPINPRRIFRHAALSGLAMLYKVAGQIPSALERERIQFLYLHHVFEDEEDSFRKILELLLRNHHSISYSEAVERIWTGDIDKPYIVFSFDDGLKSCLRAARIMGEFGIKACFFLCMSIVGETDYCRIKEFCSSRLYKPPMEFLSWADVEALLHAGHEVGSHTMTHPNMAQLSAEQVQTEITESYELLAQRIGDVRHFSWPLGRFFHIAPTAVRTVFETGFESCASAERGCHVFQADKEQLCIRRNNVMAKWPVNHVFYFMAKNSRRASIYDNQWPQGWSEVIQDN